MPYISSNESALVIKKPSQEQNPQHLYQSNYPFFEKYLREASLTGNSKIAVLDENTDLPDTYPFTNDYKNLVLVTTPLNTLRSPDQFLSSINEKVLLGTVLLVSAEISEITRERILSRYIPPFNWIIYLSWFTAHRAFPKFSGWSKKIYAGITSGKTGAQHRSEILGRVTAHGFTIFDYSIQEGRLFIAASKTSKGVKDVNGSTSLIFSMGRIGQSGKEVKVYKLRTMHAYSQYLHEFMLSQHGLDSDGKFRNDFRIATWGRFLRKYWIDELPMIINLLKGDIKIVGVRPISKKFLDLYPKDVQALRRKTKPGFIPPSYAFSPSSMDEIIQLEKQYLLQYFDKPWQTDLKYFFKVLKNVVVSKIRSR